MSPIQVKKVSDEGSSSPFITRLMFGVLILRDKFYLLNANGPEKQRKKSEFDSAYKPVLDAAEAVRDAARDGLRLIDEHKSRISNGDAVQFRNNQYDILENIDSPLSQSVDKLINQSIVATKGALQPLLRDLFGIDIGFLFQCDKNFASGIQNLRMMGEAELADYLSKVRVTWMADLQNLRNQHEHDGRSMERLDYHLVSAGKVQITFPKVVGLSVDEFLNRTANRVLSFIESLMAYALTRDVQYPIFISEIPLGSRDPIDPQRFELGAKGLTQNLPWRIRFYEEDQFV